MKVLLTGAAGNLGTALRERGRHDFVAFGREDWPRLEALLGQGVDVVVHAAWDLRTRVASHPSSVLDDNVMATSRLLEACREHQVPKFAYVSTCAVYGDNRSTSEDVEPHPTTLNGITKLLNELVIQEACADAGIECQIYRVFNMYGGADRFSILSHLQRALIEDRPFVLNNQGEAVRDFVHVTDVADVIAELIPLKLPYAHINVGTGRGTRVADVVEAVRRLRPQLRVEQRDVAEVRYSRADLTRLKAVLGPRQFVSVMAFVKRAFDGGREPGTDSRA